MNTQSAPMRFLSACTLALLALSGARAATDIDISQAPLLLGTGAEPNIIMGIDDSGSMDFETLMPTNGGTIWWNSNYKSFVGCDQNDDCTNTTSSDTFNFNKTSNFYNPWSVYTYLFPFPGVHTREPTNTFQYMPPFAQYAWARSSDYNDAYFDPTVSYGPWVKADGTSFGNMSPTAAEDDPYLYPTTTVNLTTPVQDSQDGFALQSGMTIPAGTVLDTQTCSGYGYRRTCTDTWSATTSATTVTRAQTTPIQYFPATFWLQAATPAAAITAAGSGYSSFVAANLLTGSGPAGETMYGFEIKPANFGNVAQYTAAIQNFANWFSYYRKRHLALRASLTQVFSNLTNTRVGMGYMHETPANGAYVMYDMNNASQKASLFQDFLDNTGTGGTPTWGLLNTIGQQYMRTNSGAPITQACQKNFAIIFTDGYADYPYDHSSPVGTTNVDAGMGAPYADNVGGTLADVGAYYYLNNLRPDLTPGLVAPDPGCSDSPPAPGADCETFPHMDTYAVTVVPQGLIWNNPTANGLPSPQGLKYTTDPYSNPPPWPAASAFSNYSPTGLDDLWHATVDGHGLMFAAKTPQQIATQLSAALASISAHLSSATAVATNSTSLNTNTNIFQATFQSSGWSGDLVAFKANTNGTVNMTPLWDAQQLLDDKIQDGATGDGWQATSRFIATWNPASGSAGAGVPFEWSDLSSTQQADLQTSSTDTLGQDRLDYLRGDRANESPNGDDFRTRSHVLGDIVDSNPLYIAAPSGPYGITDASYVNFEKTQASRMPMVYVGANDGMLHAFNAVTGEEEFAFVPDGVFSNLINLTQVPYNHQFFVDGSPTAGDVKFSDATWHTLLVSGLGAGGKSVFALDVTDPGSITSESTLAGDVQWEYSDPSGLLGYTYGKPVIAYTSDTSSPFMVFFGSGYDNSDGNPYLYAVNAQTGALIARINLCAAVTPNPCVSTLPNGLSSPVAVNSEGSPYSPDDTVYAGDLQGNLWKVNISDANPANWTVQLLFQARDSSGNPQPITTAPVVSLHPDYPGASGTVVYFGTGQLLSTADLTTKGTQSFYAVWDKPGNSTTLTRGSLQVQTLTQVVGPDGTTVRTATSTPVNWNTKYGWYEDLPIAGERVIADPRLENGAAVYTTYLPPTDSCGANGAAFLMVVNFATGGAFADPEMDLNGDGKLNSSDQVDGQNPVGLYLGSVYAASPTIISASLGQIQAVKLVSESNGTIRSVGQHGFRTARQSWREVPPGN